MSLKFHFSENKFFFLTQNFLLMALVKLLDLFFCFGLQKQNCQFILIKINSLQVFGLLLCVVLSEFYAKQSTKIVLNLPLVFFLILSFHSPYHFKVAQFCNHKLCHCISLHPPPNSPLHLLNTIHCSEWKHLINSINN